MKKIVLIVLVLLPYVLFAQDSYDAYKYAQTDLFGTARYVSMSGAFAALGGDPSAVHDNPAALGVFRQSDASLTLDININRTLSDWGASQYTGRAFRLSCGQANWIMNFKTGNAELGLITHSLMIGYHRLKNFDRSIYAKASQRNWSMTDYMALQSSGLYENNLSGDIVYNNVDVGWLSKLGYDSYLIDPDTVNADNWYSILSQGETVIPEFETNEAGWTDEYNVGWGANFSNRFYVGISAAIRAMRYSKNVRYDEIFAQGGRFELSTYYNSSGVGFNGVFGLIYRPVDMLRLAASFQTPTLMNYKESYYATIETWGINNKDYARIETPHTSPINYQLTNPMRVTVGLATTFSTRALLSFQYDYEAYNLMKFRSNTGNTGAWDAENKQIKSNLSSMHTFRIGGELFLSGGFAVRLGYAMKSPLSAVSPQRSLAINAMRTDAESQAIRRQHYIGCGFGFRNQLLITDIAYQYRISHEAICPFDGADVFGLNDMSHRIVITIGIK